MSRHARAVQHAGAGRPDDAPLPCNLDAERATLAAGLLGVPLDELTRNDYAGAAHRAIFDAVAALGERHETADLITVKDELTRAGTLAAAGGAAYLAELLDGVPRVSSVASWAGILREAARARRRADLGARVAHLAADPEADPGELLRVLDDLREVTGAPVDSRGLDADALDDATDVAAQGRRIAETGIPWRVEGIVPALGMLGFLVAYAKVGKTSLAQAMGGAVARGESFLGRATTRTRVLVIAAEDPPEYVAYLARTLVTASGAMTFYRRGVALNDAGLGRIRATVTAGGYGLVLLSSWQALVRGLLRDENDNSGAVSVVEAVKVTARACGVPFLIDAHSGRGEDQADAADPVKALRGASAAAGAADYILSLRYAAGSFSPLRRLSGKGRFVSFEPEMIAYDPETGTYESTGPVKSAAAETTWRRIDEMGALSSEPRRVDAIVRAAGLVGASGKVSGANRRAVHAALRGRPGVEKAVTDARGGRGTCVTYRLAGDQS